MRPANTTSNDRSFFLPENPSSTRDQVFKFQAICIRTPKCGPHSVLGYKIAAVVTFGGQNYYHSIMSGPANGTYTIVNVSTGSYLDLAVSYAVPYAPIIAWGSSPPAPTNEQVSFPLLSFCRLSF
jgi:hypothetical protein